MPYIKQHKRTVLDPAIDELHRSLVELELDNDDNNLEGNLNYAITRLLKMCYGESYAEINDAMGVLTCIAFEYYRRVAAPYEDQKIFDNGDVEANLLAEQLGEIVVEHITEDTTPNTSNEGC